MNALILESIIHGRANNTVVNHTSGIISEDFESHGISNIRSNTNPPAHFFFGRGKGLVRVERKNLFIEPVFKESRDVLESTMVKFAWDLVAQGLIGADIMDISNVFASQEPAVIGGTCPVKKNLGVILKEFDSMEFGRVLLRVTGFSELILDKVFLIDLGCAHTLLYLGIIMAKNTGYPLITNEILVSIRHLALGSHSIDIDHVGMYTIENLCTRGSPKCAGVGKIGVCGYRFS